VGVVKAAAVAMDLAAGMAVTPRVCTESLTKNVSRAAAAAETKNVESANQCFRCTGLVRFRQNWMSTFPNKLPLAIGRVKINASLTYLISLPTSN
jgi:hypothetical protein